MKKIYLLLATIMLILVSCKENMETETPLPQGLFFRGEIQEKTKTITVGVNGFVDQYFDSVSHINDTLLFTSGMGMYQGSSGYYISTKEKISFEIVNIPFQDTASNNDSLWHQYLFTHQTLPFYSAMTADSNKSYGFRIRWCDYQGTWYSTSKADQTSSVTIDTSTNLSTQNLSVHQLFISFEAKLCNNDKTKCLYIKNGKARIKLYNYSMP